MDLEYIRVQIGSYNVPGIPQRGQISGFFRFQKGPEPVKSPPLDATHILRTNTGNFTNADDYYAQINRADDFQFNFQVAASANLQAFFWIARDDWDRVLVGVSSTNPTLLHAAAHIYLGKQVIASTSDFLGECVAIRTYYGPGKP